MGQQQPISVIIPTKDRYKDVMQCIESVVTQSLIPDEIVIVDGSRDGRKLQSKIEAFKRKGIRFLYIHTRPGLTYQRNVGINASSGDTIIFLDDDVILDRDYIRQIMHVFNDDVHKKVGGVTGNDMLKKTKNSLAHFIAHYYKTFFFLFTYSNGKFRLSGWPSLVSDKVKKAIPVECLAGCNMAFRREVFEDLRFDEKLHGYAFMEDCDIACRVSRKYQNIYTPFARLFHNVTPISRDKEYDRLKMEIENHYYLFKKNFPQDIKHKFAFVWSCVGLFIQQAFTVIIKKSGGKEGMQGLMDGFQTIKRRKNVVKT